MPDGSLVAPYIFPGMAQEGAVSSESPRCLSFGPRCCAIRWRKAYRAPGNTAKALM